MPTARLSFLALQRAMRLTKSELELKIDNYLK